MPQCLLGELSGKITTEGKEYTEKHGANIIYRLKPYFFKFHIFSAFLPISQNEAAKMAKNTALLMLSQKYSKYLV